MRLLHFRLKELSDTTPIQLFLPSKWQVLEVSKLMSLFRYISSLSTTFIHLQNIFKIYKSSPVTRTESMEFTCIQAASWWSTPTAPFSVGHWWAKRTITVFGGELNPMESYYESNIWDLENWSCIRFPPKNLPRIWCLNSKACRGLHKNTVCKWKLLKTIYTAYKYLNWVSVTSWLP